MPRGAGGANRDRKTESEISPENKVVCILERGILIP
jgi:hypothetical protein